MIYINNKIKAHSRIFVFETLILRGIRYLRIVVSTATFVKDKIYKQFSALYE